MKVRIKTGFWDVRDYAMSVGESGLLFCSGSEEWQVSFSEILRFSLAGAAGSPDRFTMETTSGNYEGYFARTEDARETIDQLSRRSGQRVEISLITV